MQVTFFCKRTDRRNVHDRSLHPIYGDRDGRVQAVGTLVCWWNRGCEAVAGADEAVEATRWLVPTVCSAGCRSWQVLR